MEIVCLLSFLWVMAIYFELRSFRGAVIRDPNIEKKIDAILEKLGIEFDPYTKVSPEIMALARNGSRIEAIKKYREVTGAGLKEAKEAIDTYLRSIK